MSSFQTLQILGTTIHPSTISTSFPAIHPSKTFPAILPSNFSSTKSPRIVRAEIVERWSLLKYFFLSSLEEFFVLTNTIFRLSRQDDFLYLSTSTTLEVVKIRSKTLYSVENHRYSALQMVAYIFIWPILLAKFNYYFRCRFVTSFNFAQLVYTALTSA